MNPASLPPTSSRRLTIFASTSKAPSIPPRSARSLPPDLSQFLGEWEWRRPPVVRLALRGASRAPETWTGDGTVALQRTRFRGVWMNSATRDLHFENGALTFDNFRVTRDEGVGTGSFTYDFVKHEVRLKECQEHAASAGRDSLDRSEILQGGRALQISPAAER